MRYSPAVSGGQDEVLPPRVLADQQRRVCRVGAPAEGSVEQLPVPEPREIRRDGPADACLRRVRVRVGRVLRVGPGHRHGPRRPGAVRLVLLVAREARELVADLDDPELVGLEEEADVAVVNDGDALVLGSFLGTQLDVRVYPCLMSSVDVPEVLGYPPKTSGRALSRSPWNSTGPPDPPAPGSTPRRRGRLCRQSTVSRPLSRRPRTRSRSLHLQTAVA